MAVITRIIGDIHGEYHDYRMVLRGCENSIQVGDFGIGFFKDHWHNMVNENARAEPTHRFIRGNHDDPARCKTMINYIEDGTVENGVMYIGGAWSIDQQYRTEGVSWWPDEELSYEELQTMVDKYRDYKPRVMITHDCPTSIAWEMFVSRWGAPHHKTRTAQAFQAMFEYHQPEHWFFGHWHDTRDLTLFGTKFQCLGELDYMDVEL
jgi:Icc-related predicted phosphoesterase